MATTNTKKGTELATVETFTIANRYEGMDPELLAELQDQMDDLDDEAGIACRMIKIPAGGGLAASRRSGTDQRSLKVPHSVSRQSWAPQPRISTCSA